VDNGGGNAVREAGNVRAGRSRGRLALAGLMALVLVAAGARLDRYRSVVIWPRRFTYAFGAAELAPAR
jgi:hypothetical protein